MKKILFVLVAIFVCGTINAQLVTSTSFKETRAKTLWYVKAGMTMANMSADGESAGNLVGYNVGIAFDRPVGGGVFWGMGLTLGTKGYKFSEGGYEVKLNANKLEIPINLGYKYSINEDFAVDARVGGFVNYDVFGKYSEDDGRDSESVNLGDLEDYDRFSAGIQFGVGVWYQHLNFNITYQNGLVKQNEAKERNWMFSLGYAF